MLNKGLPYDDAAQPVQVLISGYGTVPGWRCRTCGKVYLYDHAELAAKYCHASSRTCQDCGDRTSSKSYIICAACREKRYLEKWLAFEEVEWDGTTPLVLHNSDTYFFSVDDLSEYLYEMGEEGVELEDLRLCLCRNEKMSPFCLSEYLCDLLPEDTYASTWVNEDEINASVNEAIKKICDSVWIETNKRPSIESVRKHLGE